MADDPFQRRFAADASLLPHMADLANDRVLVALLAEPDYRAASFLDQRLLTDRIRREWLPWDALPDLGAAARAPQLRGRSRVKSVRWSGRPVGVMPTSRWKRSRARRVGSSHAPFGSGAA